MEEIFAPRGVENRRSDRIGLEARVGVGTTEGEMLRLKAVVVLACLVSVIGLSRADEDIADGEDGYMDTAVESAVIESCAG